MSCRHEFPPSGRLPVPSHYIDGLVSKQPRRAVRSRSASPLSRRRVVVAIPVRNEAAHIAACLSALARQEGTAPDRIVLLLNGCTDGTLECVRGIAPQLDVDIDIVERHLEGASATAGVARRLALQNAAEGLHDRDVLMTTDADGQVAPDWIEANLTELAAGAEAVCGRARIDPIDAMIIPAHLHDDDANEARLAVLLDEIAALLDPDPADPWPRHTESSGASIAVTVGAWRRAGGIPPISCGEDRAFIDNLRQVDARIRHANSVWVTVSGRTLGRAAGGMADTIRRRIIRQDEFTDSAIEPASERFRRISLRAQARAMWAAAYTDCAPLAHALAMPEQIVRQSLSTPFFGRAWKDLESHSAVLRPRRVRFADLAVEIDAASTLCAQARDIHACEKHAPDTQARASPAPNRVAA